MKTMELTIEGMTCGHCAASVTRELSQLSGIETVEVDQPGGSAKLEFVDTPQEDELSAAISKAGYKLVSVKLV